MGKLLGCENTVIEDVDWREENSGDAGGPALRLIVYVRPHKRLAHRCREGPVPAVLAARALADAVTQ